MNDELLRRTMAEIERHIALLTNGVADEQRTHVAALDASWRELVTLLALGPAPQLRQCPICGNSGMRAATVCGYCWTRLAPLPPL